MKCYGLTPSATNVGTSYILSESLTVSLILRQKTDAASVGRNTPAESMSDSHKNRQTALTSIERKKKAKYIGIVGSEEKKFTPKTKEAAIQAITNIVESQETEVVIVSGRCHLGGIDIWAEEIADTLGLDKLIFPPEVHRWDGGRKIGYKQRNIQIAEASDEIYVIVPATLPPGYAVEPWNRRPCYHCQVQRIREGNAVGYHAHHVKSGACWTAWYAVEKLGKHARWIII